MKRVLLFLLTAASLVLALRLLNWLPTVAVPEKVVRKTSFEELLRLSRTREIDRPAYFPADLEWPPAEIFTRPEGRAIIMHFRSRDTGAIALAVSRVETGSAPIPARIEPVRLLSRKTMLLKGRKIALELALCSDGRPCNRASWSEEGTDHTVIARGNEETLLRISQGLMPSSPR